MRIQGQAGVDQERQEAKYRANLLCLVPHCRPKFGSLCLAAHYPPGDGKPKPSHAFMDMVWAFHVLYNLLPCTRSDD